MEIFITSITSLLLVISHITYISQYLLLQTYFQYEIKSDICNSMKWFQEIISLCHSVVNSSSPCAAYIHQWSGSTLVQVLACRLYGAKPLPEPMLAYCQLDSWEQISVKFESEFYYFIQENAFEIVVCHNCGHFVLGRGVKVPIHYLSGTWIWPLLYLMMAYLLTMLSHQQALCRLQEIYFLHGVIRQNS